MPADPLLEACVRDQDDVFSPKSAPNNKENIPDRKENAPVDFQLGRSGSVVTQEASIRAFYHTVPEDFGLTPQELAARNEPIVRGTKTLRETKSTFFGGPGFTIARTTSPFRRALAEADYNSTILNGGVPISLEDFPLPVPLYIRPKSATIADGGVPDPNAADKAYSESVYSRTTSGQGPGAANSALSLPMAEDEVPEISPHNTSTGDVVILDRATYRLAMPGTKSHRNTSSASSTEWKKWMSSEVAKLERARDNTNSAGSYVNYALPTMPKSFHAGHVRESAQINDDDTDIAQGKITAVKQPIGILQQNASVHNISQMSLQNPPFLKPILKNRSTVSLVENIDSNNTNQSAIPIPPSPPPIPMRSPLRPVLSKSSLRSVNIVNTVNTPRTQSAPNSAIKISSVNSRNMLHKRNTSQTTLRNVKSLETPVKLVKRNGRKLSNAGNTSSSGGGLNTTVDNQFGSTLTRSRTPGAAWSANRENQSPQQKDEIYGTDGAGLMGPTMSGGAQELDAQQMGSKRMVDLFLSSRRRRIAGGSEESGVFI
jgi:hypothetical protein